MTLLSLHDDRLGELPRATSVLDDGTVLTHDWFVASIPSAVGTDAAGTPDATIELMIDGTDPETASELLAGLHTALDSLPALLRVATDAVVTRFSEQEPPAHELDEAASDLALEAIEAAPDGTVVFHLIDTCGSHFPDGYWPTARLTPGGAVVEVTVES